MSEIMTTYRGISVPIKHPETRHIFIEDIAHALSYACRFNGHCSRFYSVAQHSVNVSLMVRKEFAFPALLHDAAEAYLGDFIAPLKQHFRNSGVTAFDILEEKFMRVILDRFMLTRLYGSRECQAEIKQADSESVYHELIELTNYTPKRIDVEFGKPDLSYTSPEEAEEMFLNRFNVLFLDHKSLVGVNRRGLSDANLP